MNYLKPKTRHPIPNWDFQQSKCIWENESWKAKPQRELKVKEDIKNYFIFKVFKRFVGSVLIFSSRQHVEFTETSRMCWDQWQWFFLEWLKLHILRQFGYSFCLVSWTLLLIFKNIFSWCCFRKKKKSFSWGFYFGFRCQLNVGVVNYYTYSPPREKRRTKNWIIQ